MKFLLKKYFTHHARLVTASIANPLHAQHAVFSRLKSELQGSELSIQSGFEQCSILEDCRNLPVSTSETLEPYFARVFHAGALESRIFGRSKIVGIGRSSGSTGNPKNIPLNQAYFRSYDRTLLRMIACTLYSTGAWDFSLSGKRVLLGSRPLLEPSPSGLPVKDISGFLLTRSSRFSRRLYLPQHEDLFLDDWGKKADLILEQARGQNVVSISGIPALAIDFAKRVKSATGVERLTDLWPNLRLFVYGGVPLSPAQKQEIKHSWCGQDHELFFLETYFATEGALAFSFDPREEGLELNLLENLYLFQSRNGAFLFAHELEQGEIYSVFVTTPGGLIHYQMGDLVEVISTHPLRIRVSGREKEEISMTGEKITLAQLDLALAAAGFVGGTHLPVIWIEQDDRPNLVWGIPSSPLPLAARLDEELCRVNVLYREALVHEKVIGPSKVVALPESMFTGRRKPKRIFNSRAEFEAFQSKTPSSPSSDDSSEF